MVFHKEREHIVLEALYNKKHKHGCLVVENAFKILEQTFCELLCKTKLHITLVFDMVTCYALLHNLLITRKAIDMDGVINIFIIETNIKQL